MLVLTGSGLKATPRIAELLADGVVSRSALAPSPAPSRKGRGRRRDETRRSADALPGARPRHPDAQHRGHGRALSRHGVPLRPHMKTAKSIDVARLATAGQPGGITVSTLAEAEYFAGHGIADILYAVGITPQKLDQVAKLNTAGAAIIVLTDDLDTASTIAAHRQPPRVLIEIDTGEGRGGVTPDDDLLLEIAARLGPYLAGVMTHAGHSYSGRSIDDMVRIAEAERAGVVRAAETPARSRPRSLHRLDGQFADRAARGASRRCHRGASRRLHVR